MWNMSSIQKYLTIKTLINGTFTTYNDISCRVFSMYQTTKAMMNSMSYTN